MFYVYKRLHNGKEEWQATFLDYKSAKDSTVFVFSVLQSRSHTFVIKDKSGNILDEISYRHFTI